MTMMNLPVCFMSGEVKKLQVFFGVCIVVILIVAPFLSAHRWVVAKQSVAIFLIIIGLKLIPIGSF